MNRRAAAVLYVEDVFSNFERMRITLAAQKIELTWAANSLDAEEHMRERPIEAVLLDVELRGSPKTGVGLHNWLQSNYPEIPVIIFSDHAAKRELFELGRRKAHDFFPQNANEKEVGAAIWAGVEEYRRWLEAEREIQSRTGFFGEGRLADTCWKSIKASRHGSGAVLILGPRGTEKSEIAKGIHSCTRPKIDGVFVGFAAGAAGEEQASRELFGSGSATWRDVESVGGLSAEADGGTLFIDKIHELPMPLQSRLKELLEAKYFRRFIAASYEEWDRLKAMTKLKNPRFRADLLEILSQHIVSVPSLKQRLLDSEKDFRVLVEALIGSEADRLRCLRFRISDRAIFELRQHDWPGNIRELRDFVHRLLALKCSHVDKAEIERVMPKE